MNLKFTNTQTGKKEVLKPIDFNHIKMYVCGPTVYDVAHIGNARPVVCFDMLYRLLCHTYGHVTYVRNITDIDDKIIVRAQENGESIHDLTTRTTEKFHAHMGALNALSPTHEPKATKYVGQMIAMISALVAKGLAYEKENHVLFATSAYDGYGKLSNRNHDDLLAGARVEIAPYKQNPMDFVLWKPSSDDQPGWDSPWGRGRPGWHIECSAMAHDLLGDTFDIHGGGQDLIFPHHENERAQSCGLGHKFANLWMHNGYVMVDGEKMSKSLGNFTTVADLMDDGHHGETIRLALLSCHYRQPLDFTTQRLKDAKSILDKLYRRKKPGGEVIGQVIEALADDLNTPLALSHLQAIDDDANMTATAQFMGFLLDDENAWFQGGGDDENMASLIQQRNNAKKAKDFQTADKIRDDLLNQGIILEDTPQGTTWRKA